MKRVLIYGDSNSWGYLDDASGIRAPLRWPVVMQSCLAEAGNPVELIEECLPGRTSDIDDPQEGPHMNGHTPLKSILLSHQPLDLVLIMLGTNDFKLRFQKTTEDIATSLIRLAQEVQSITAGRGGWHAQNCPQPLLICPPKIGDRADDTSWPRYAEWQRAVSKSTQLPHLLATKAAMAGLKIIDGNDGAQSSDRDPIHWSSDTHLSFGRFMAAEIAYILSRDEGS